MTFLRDLWDGGPDAERYAREEERDLVFIDRLKEAFPAGPPVYGGHAAPEPPVRPSPPRATTQADVLAAVQALHADVTALRAEVAELHYEVRRGRVEH